MWQQKSCTLKHRVIGIDDKRQEFLRTVASALGETWKELDAIL